MCGPGRQPIPSQGTCSTGFGATGLGPACTTCAQFYDDSAPPAPSDDTKCVFVPNTKTCESAAQARQQALIIQTTPCEGETNRKHALRTLNTYCNHITS